MRARLLALLLVSGCASFAHPNYRVWASHPDNPVDRTHVYTQPAIAWDVEFALTSYAINLAVAKITPFSPFASAVIPCVGLGAGPHLAQWVQHQSHPSAHWAFTLSDRCLPVATETHSLAPWLITTALLMGYDR
jgi:hypothetical protein